MLRSALVLLVFAALAPAKPDRDRPPPFEVSYQAFLRVEPGMSVADVLKALGPPKKVRGDFFGQPERTALRGHGEMFSRVYINRGGVLGTDYDPPAMDWSTDLKQIEVVYQRGRVAVIHYVECDCALWDLTCYLAGRGWQWLSPKLPPRH
jgi:hypothetical protein